MLPFFDPLGDHVSCLSRLQRLPEIFDGGVCLLNGGFETFNGSSVMACFAGISYSGGDPLDVAIGQ